MPSLVDYLITAIVSLFVVMDPVGNVPAYLTMTAGDDPQRRRRTCRTASLVSGSILTTFALLGDRVMKFFGITTHALQVAGGVILFMIAMQMLQARRTRVKHSDEEEQEGIEKEDISIVPLAIPLLGGPGAIATVLVLVSQGGGLILLGAVLTAIWINALATWVILRNSEYLSRLLGKTGLKVINRLMGLLLAAMAAQFVMDGLEAYWKRLG